MAAVATVDPSVPVSCQQVGPSSAAAASGAQAAGSRLLAPASGQQVDPGSAAAAPQVPSVSQAVRARRTSGSYCGGLPWEARAARVESGSGTSRSGNLQMDLVLLVDDPVAPAEPAASGSVPQPREGRKRRAGEPAGTDAPASKKARAVIEVKMPHVLAQLVEGPALLKTAWQQAQEKLVEQAQAAGTEQQAQQPDAGAAAPAIQQPSPSATQQQGGWEPEVSWTTKEGAIVKLRARDLLHLWRAKDQVVRSVITQSYTYMQVWQLCFAAISCYHFIWLLYCPPRGEDRRTLYISKPIPYSTRGSDTEVAAVTAVTWLTCEALEHGGGQVDLPFPPDQVEAAGQDPQAEGGEDATDSQPDAGAEPGSEEEFKSGDEKSSRSDQASRWGGSKQAGGRQGGRKHGGSKQMTAAQPPVQLRHVIQDGHHGLVAIGSIADEDVIVKLLGPDQAGLHSWQVEVDMYSRLSSKQGHLIPTLMAADHLRFGVHYLATRRIDGHTVDELLRAGRAADLRQAYNAAHVGLLELQATVPGFLHGDLRGPNLLVPSRTASDVSSLGCIFLDLGYARMDGTAEEQAQELKALKRIFCD